MLTHKILLSLVIAASFSSAASATSYANEPVYDCTAEETKIYIEQVTHNVFAPSPITKPEEFNKSYAEAAQKKAEATGDTTCSTIFTDGTLDDGWKKAVDEVKNVDFGAVFSGMDGAILEKILEEAKKRILEENSKALGTIGDDICKLMSSDNLKGMLLDGVNKKFGMNAKKLRLQSFADAITEEQLLKADEDVLLLLSEDKLIDKVGKETRKEMREIRKDLWEKF
tara:strand:- start:2108 stop:2785 length:678 start_codon:yes stop_codon:yes gene_type:complete